MVRGGLVEEGKRRVGGGRVRGGLVVEGKRRVGGGG